MPLPAQRGASARQSAQRRGPSGLSIIGLTVILLILAGIVLVYFVPSATVVVSLPGKTYTQALQLVASNKTQSDLPTETVTQNFSANGQGSATGTQMIGNAKASGLASFTNNGAKDVVIPTGTIITTSSGISFQTTSEAYINAGSTISAVPITAQVSGDNSNVDTGTVTVIPASSLNNIAAYNKVSSSTLNLTVTNANKITGGGASPVPSVTAQDLQKLAQTLHGKLQNAIQTWLNTQLHPGDQHATPQPDVQGSTTPLDAEHLVGAPDANTVADTGTFSGTLTVKVSVLVVRIAELQSAAGKQLNILAGKEKTPEMLADTHIAVNLTNINATSSADGSTLTIKTQASGLAIPQISSQELSNDLTGKSKEQVQNNFATYDPQFSGLHPSIHISIFPGFYTILPLKPDRITIILKAQT